ncbi:MAG: M15 family metallopeptidase [Lachnospiraceae bacterium]|nr:M15 family metallopeptidase [Lachnospiraceae bacterium]
MYKRLSLSFLTFVLLMILLPIKAYAQNDFTLEYDFTSDHMVRLKMTHEEGADFDGYMIERASTKTGPYENVGTCSKTKYSSYSYYWDDDEYDDNLTTYSDSSVLTPYTTYYYKVSAFTYAKDQYGDETGEKTIITVKDIEVLYPGAGPVITSGKRKGKNGSTISWSPVEGAEGYVVYLLTDMDEKGNMTWPDTSNEQLYTQVSDFSLSTLSASYKKLTNGVTYYYRIYAYKTINGNRVLSFSSDVKGIAMDYYAYASEGYYQKVKRAFGTEKKRDKNFKTEAKARRQMKTIKIKVWDFKNGRNGKKITRVKYLTVNKNLAPTVKQIFKEVYESDEKQVIHDIGAYSYRTGQHMYGLAIDVNPNENYMIDGKKVMSGSFWKPKKSAYSIPLECDFVRIMNRYGFSRGFWGNRKDYMHFSYFGT